MEAVVKALEILDCLAEKGPLSIKDIIQETGLTRSRIMRLMGTLESKEYIIETHTNKVFNLGVRVAILGKAFERSNHLETLVRPALKDLVDETQESATFYVTNGIERIALIREEGLHAIRFSVHEGQRIPLHAGAAGKILMAFGPPDLFDHVTRNSRLQQITPNTITNIEKLKSQLDRIRETGYALSKGENVIEAYSLAAPVFSAKRELIGSIGISGPLYRLEDGNIDERIECVVRSAELLSNRFRFREPMLQDE